MRGWRPAPEPTLPATGSRENMKAGEDARGARGEGPRKLGLCVLCGLPAAGKSTFARALSQRLRQERGWAAGVVAYDDVMPDAFLEEAGATPLVSAGARPLVRAEGAGPRLRRREDAHSLPRPLRGACVAEAGCGGGKWSWVNTERADSVSE